MYYRQKRGRLGQAAQGNPQVATVPACTGGINSRDALLGMPPQDCLYAYNLMPSEYGMRLRQGYREWATVLSNKPINTVIPFEGQIPGTDKLWAVTEDGIYDVTAEGTKVDTPIVPFTVQGDGSGWGVWTEFTNDATDRFLFYADEKNGLWEYEEETGLWSRPGITGPVIENVAFVTTWKNRLWFIEEDAGDAWYMTPDSKSGQAEKFTFGSKFQHGGDLRALYSWTIDGGEGIDDYLIAISTGGDVLVYKGFDPAIAPEQGGLSLVGSYFIGVVPESRRIAEGYGGELYMLSTYGVISIRDLLQGVEASAEVKSASAKINRFLRADVQLLRDERAWAIKIHPADGFLQIIRPYPDSEFWENDRDSAIQYNQNLLTQAWGAWRRVPVNCAATFNSLYYFGDQDGRVFVNDGPLDRVTLDSDELYDNLSTSIAPGDGWTQITPNEFEQDGTQELAFLVITQPFTTIPGARYRIRYTSENVVDNGALHGVSVGTQFPLVGNQGNGTWELELVADVAQNSIAVIGQRSNAPGIGDNFQGTIKDIEVYQIGNLGDPIPFSLLTSYQGLDNHALNKRVSMIRTLGVTGGSIATRVKAVYDYDIRTQLYGYGADVDYSPGEWNIANWDQAYWDAAIQGQQVTEGGSGLGRAVALAMIGEADTRVTLIGWDITYTSGGFL